eukprot:gene30677-37928_t
MTLIYIDRLIERQQLVLTPLNVHRLLITCVMLSAKYHDDLFYNNAYYAKLGGLTLPELNFLETDLLRLLDFSLFIQVDAFTKYALELRNYGCSVELFPSPVSVALGETTSVAGAGTSQLSGSALYQAALASVDLSYPLVNAALDTHYTTSSMEVVVVVVEA